MRPIPEHDSLTTFLAGYTAKSRLLTFRLCLWTCLQTTACIVSIQAGAVSIGLAILLAAFRLLQDGGWRRWCYPFYSSEFLVALLGAIMIVDAACLQWYSQPIRGMQAMLIAHVFLSFAPQTRGYRKWTYGSITGLVAIGGMLVYLWHQPIADSTDDSIEAPLPPRAQWSTLVPDSTVWNKVMAYFENLRVLTQYIYAYACYWLEENNGIYPVPIPGWCICVYLAWATRVAWVYLGRQSTLGLFIITLVGILASVTLDIAWAYLWLSSHIWGSLSIMSASLLYDQAACSGHLPKESRASSPKTGARERTVISYCTNV